MSDVKRWETDHGDMVTVWYDPDGDEYRWRVRAANGEVVGHGEGHPRQEDAVTAASRHHPPVASEG